MFELRNLGADPGDRALLELAASSNRVTVAIDADFGELIYRRNVPRAGLIRLPDASTEQRIDLVAEIIVRYRQELKNRAIVTVRGEHIRVSNSPNN